MAQKEIPSKRGKGNKANTKSGMDNRKDNAFETGANPENRSRSRER